MGESWTPFDVVEREAEQLRSNRLVLSSDTPENPLSSTGTSSLSYHFDVESQLETYADLIQRHVAASPSTLDRLSPLFLPVRLQYTLRFLLLVPLGALAMAVLRNVIGLRTFGMFMPMLIALAFTHTGFLWGTAFLLGIIAFALLSRVWIQPLHLLLAPRIAFILTLVVLLMLAVMLLGERTGIPASGETGRC